MKANELMIGDWVQGNPCGQHCDRNNNTYYKIAVLDIGNHCWGYSVCGAIVELKYDNIFPIPLTKEILEKNGFEKLRESRFLLEDLEDNYWVKFYPKDTNYTCGAYDYIDIDCGCLSIREMPIKFVHELQHALRLCGIKKEIVL